MPMIGRCACCARGAASWICPWTVRRSSIARPIDGLYFNAGWCYGGFKATPGSGWCFAHLIARDEPHPSRGLSPRPLRRRALDRREGRRRPSQFALSAIRMRIPCPFCGPARVREFAYFGDATVSRPDPSCCGRRRAASSTSCTCATIRPGRIASSGFTAGCQRGLW